MAFVGLYLAKPWEATTPKEQEKAVKPLFADDSKPKDVDRVEMVLKGGEQRTFVKEGEDWRMTQPVEAMANKWQVDQIVRDVSDLKYDKIYAKDDKARPGDKISGLTEPNATVKLFSKDKLQAELAIGSRLPTGKGQYVRLAGTDSIYESESDLSSVYNKRLSALRDSRVLKFETKDVQRVTVEGQQNFVLVKSGDNWLIESPIRGRADKSKADGIISPLTYLSAQEWKDDEPSSLKPFGLDPARVKVTVETRREVPPKVAPGEPHTQPTDTQPSMEDKTYVLLVGGPTETSGASYFAKLQSSPAVFSISEHTVKQIAPPLPELQDKTLAKIEPAKVKKIEAQTPGGNMVLTRNEKGEWAFADNTPADTAAVDDLLNAVKGLQATAFADAREQLIPQDWNKPRSKIAITQEGQLEPVTLLVGSASASGRMVYVRNQAEEPVAAVPEEAVVPLLLPPVSYRDRQVLNVARDRVDRMEITRQDQPKVVLTKANNKWSMAEPVSADADADAVRNVLTDLATLQAKRVAGLGSKEKFGLGKPDVTLAVWVQPVTALPNAKVVGQTTQPATTTQPAGTTTRPVDLAKEIEKLESLLQYQREHPETENKMATQMVQEKLDELRAQAATQPGVAERATTQPTVTADATPAAEPAPQPTIHHLHMSRRDGKVYANLDNGQMVWELDDRVYEDATAEMHDRQVTKFEIANVVDLTFESPEHAVVALRKTGEEWKYLPDPLVPLDKQKVTDVLNALREIKTHRYVTYAAEDLGKYGLAGNVWKLIVGLDNGQRTEIVLSNSGPENDPDKSRYAVAAGSKKVFLLKEDQAKKFEQKLVDFEKTDKPKTADAAEEPAGFGAAPAGFPG
ncbi:MAG: hypothetical protein AMXMBFR13_27270 [Phycisphaerae bacterium]